jgi:hypothetical protein
MKKEFNSLANNDNVCRCCHGVNDSYLCIKAQKVYLFRPSLGFLVEAEPRLENRRGQKALFGRGAHNVFRVHWGKNFEKHELIVNFQVIFDRCQDRYINWKIYLVIYHFLRYVSRETNTKSQI